MWVETPILSDSKRLNDSDLFKSIFRAFALMLESFLKNETSDPLGITMG